MVRQTTETRVQLPGWRGRGAYKAVVTTSNKMIIEDHYPIVAEPGGNYVTHITPETGTGLDFANEIVSVAQERGADIKVIGMGGCAVNTM